MTDEIDGKNPSLVRTLAAAGVAVEDIAGMTRTSVSDVRQILDQTDPGQEAARGDNGSVNTTASDK